MSEVKVDRQALEMAAYAIRDNRPDGDFPISSSDLREAIVAYLEHSQAHLAWGLSGCDELLGELEKAAEQRGYQRCHSDVVAWVGDSRPDMSAGEESEMSEREYSINGSIRGSTHFGVVTASSAKEALAKAEDELDLGVSFCHQCSGGCEDPEVVFLSAEAELARGKFETAEEDYSFGADDLKLLARLRSHAFIGGFCRWLELNEHDHHGVEHFKKLLLQLLRGDTGQGG